MIWLSNSALLYAAKVCEEIPNYSIIVFIERGRETDDVQKKLRTFTKNQHVRLFNTAFNWHVDYENGSKIKVITAGENARGNRCNLAVVSRGVDQQIIDEVVRPVETLNDPTPQADDTLTATTWATDNLTINAAELNDTYTVAGTPDWTTDAINTITAGATITADDVWGNIAQNTVTTRDAITDLGDAIRGIMDRLNNIEQRTQNNN